MKVINVSYIYSIFFISLFFLLQGHVFAQSTIFADGFETDKGWSLTGEFERGAPLGLGGDFGEPDPTSAYNGNSVLGTDLSGIGSYSGDYETNISGQNLSATSPVINCSDFT